MVRALAVIPARYASTRFPGKPLATLGKRTLLEEVWQRVTACRSLERVVVATDDERILDACRGFGAEALLTSPGHPSGTDRVAEAAVRLGRAYSIVVNVQGDEPLVTPTSLEALVATFEELPVPDMATLAEPLGNTEDLFDPNVVKVVTAHDGRALYFSRSAIPYYRGAAGPFVADFAPALERRPEGLRGYLKHQGVYAYRRETLLALSRLPPSSLERDEGLEQLRALQAGWAIRVVVSDFRSVSVDTPGDLERAAALLAEAGA